MEPNAERIFWHEDQDRDSLEIVASTPERVTVSIGDYWGAEPTRRIYLDRTAIEGLHRVLGTWLGLNEAPATPQHVSGRPAADTPELRREAAEMAIRAGGTGVVSVAHLIAMHLVHTLSCPARDSETCTCGGSVPGVPDILRMCDTCGHVKHGRGSCVALVGRGRHRCQCLESQEPSA
jgi:hypothetical protein